MASPHLRDAGAGVRYKRTAAKEQLERQATQRPAVHLSRKIAHQRQPEASLLGGQWVNAQSEGSNKIFREKVLAFAQYRALRDLRKRSSCGGFIVASLSSSGAMYSSVPTALTGARMAVSMQRPKSHSLATPAARSKALACLRERIVTLENDAARLHAACGRCAV